MNSVENDSRPLKAYIIVFSVYVGPMNSYDTSYVMSAVRKTFSREVFEDHLNAPCMVIFLPIVEGQGKIELYELYPDSNKPFDLHNIVVNSSSSGYMEESLNTILEAITELTNEQRTRKV